jgi:preprotein translocase subunit SecG
MREKCKVMHRQGLLRMTWILFGVLCLSIIPLACVTTSQETYDLKQAEREELCRVRFGWNDPMCKFMDQDALTSGGGR